MKSWSDPLAAITQAPASSQRLAPLEGEAAEDASIEVLNPELVVEDVFGDGSVVEVCFSDSELNFRRGLLVRPGQRLHLVGPDTLSPVLRVPEDRVARTPLDAISILLTEGAITEVVIDPFFYDDVLELARFVLEEFPRVSVVIDLSYRPVA